jgi:hypothetical protein
MQKLICTPLFLLNHINSLIVNMLTSSVVDHGFELLSGQAKDWDWYLLFFRKACSIKEKKQDWLAQNRG